MSKSNYEGGKQRRHFTLSSTAYEHLGKIAHEAQLSKSEALERLIRSFPAWEGVIIADGSFELLLDHSLDNNATL